MQNPQQQDESVQKEEGFVTHLVELRDRLIRAAASVVICFLALVYWAPDIYSVLANPLISALPSGTSMIATDVTAPFFVPMKVTMMVAFVLALPYVLYQVWAFIAPGLYEHEKTLALPIILSSFLLFLLGMAFAYFFVFPAVFKFVAAYTPAGVQMATDIDKYLSFVITLFLVFGLSFETPVVEMVLVRLGMVSIEKLKNFRSYFIVIAFVIAAIVTPPDVISQFMLAIPMILLYEFGIFMSRYITPREKPAEAPQQ
ncbi:MAG: twin-arginine translocase subunit TatC [Burkholderiaceae bacterium]|jgi:sec-independent protein translocase protein TatC|nr:twin-arginine translocase subunit TatC [Burkholderiaceae bacterium]